ncbi:hypothetical protein ACHAXA_006441 [Cyclostephanos tholiformis]|uniref:Clathrin light chain n=1 Tax=Cyclostephanos tholiformis TaxID=382380 RepID=A0ABD3SF98_9STRA
MADETDFFTPPAEDHEAFFAVPHPGDDIQNNIGDVYYGSMPDSQPEGDFFNPPGDAPIVLGGESYDAPNYGDDDGDVMGFAGAASYDPPPPAPSSGGMVEDVVDDDDGAEASASAGMGGLQLVPAELTPMAKWNEEWQATLLARKEEENAIKASHVEKAAEDVKAFLAEREKRREMRMAKNRSDEQEKLEAIEADLENDNSWQKVVKMIDLTQDSSEGAGDTSRMKDILVLLKNDPAKASALS